MKDRKEIKYYGIHATLALFKMRKEDIVRIYLNESNVNTFKPVLKWCSAHKKAYHIISDAELEKVTASVHHEGVCILAKEVELLSWERAFIDINQRKENVCLLYLDSVQNPHNIGSIIRSMAHFGIPYIFGEKGKFSALSPSAYRTAMGGAEVVRLVLLDKPLEALRKLKQKGFLLVTTSSHEGISLYQYSFSDRTVIIVGSESEGVSKALFSLAQDKIQIPGTGAVESLNVAVATTICVAEYYRQREL